jgi:hypothetical protein
MVRPGMVCPGRSGWGSGEEAGLAAVAARFNPKTITELEQFVK